MKSLARLICRTIVCSAGDGSTGGCQGGGRIAVVLSHGRWTFSRANRSPLVKPLLDYLTGVLALQGVRLPPTVLSKDSRCRPTAHLPSHPDNNMPAARSR